MALNTPAWGCWWKELRAWELPSCTSRPKTLCWGKRLRFLINIEKQKQKHDPLSPCRSLSKTGVKYIRRFSASFCRWASPSSHSVSSVADETPVLKCCSFFGFFRSDPSSRAARKNASPPRLRAEWEHRVVFVARKQSKQCTWHLFALHLNHLGSHWQVKFFCKLPRKKLNQTRRMGFPNQSGKMSI